MASSVNCDCRLNLALVILPAIHVLMFVVGTWASVRYRMNLSPASMADFPVSVPLLVQAGSASVLLVGVLGTAWWYFIARIGWDSWRGRISRVGSALGALLLIFVCAVGTFAIVSQVAALVSGHSKVAQVNDIWFSAGVTAVYLMSITLLLGGWLSAAVSLAAPFKKKRHMSHGPISR